MKRKAAKGGMKRKAVKGGAKTVPNKMLKDKYMIRQIANNALVTLLRQLPPNVSREKTKAILTDLRAIGKYQHYRQSVRRPGWKLADTHVDCALILMKHLNLSFLFFTGTAQQQHEEINRVLSSYDDQMPELQAQTEQQ